MVFDGENKLSIESACGTDGQAFNADHFPYSLYEWRLFEIGDDSGSKPYDIRWGPFTFKPLRLRKATFDGSGKPTALAILGSLRFDPARRCRQHRRSIGQDDVYARSDLFTLTLQWKDGHGPTVGPVARSQLSETRSASLPQRANGQFPGFAWQSRRSILQVGGRRSDHRLCQHRE
ncbi:hypothetical protein [Rhizobium sp. CCGE531]|uniref:hypothetical protein n=1 Tax=Rhizobium sp. CCGE531 TaxID=2364271 RepID=UPI0013C42504|nr:hypothetical protein [Rhizobium sp. CCGE531]